MPSRVLLTSGPNAMRESRRHTSPRASLVANRCSETGCDFTSVNSILFCSVDCALVVRFSVRLSCSIIRPSSLEWNAQRDQQWGRCITITFYMPGAQENSIFVKMRRYASNHVLRTKNVRNFIQCLWQNLIRNVADIVHNYTVGPWHRPKLMSCHTWEP